MKHIRRAGETDAVRMAEIEVFNYRLNFYPLFRNDAYYFDELRVDHKTKEYLNASAAMDAYVYDDGVVKGFIQLDGREIRKLFVEPMLQGGGIGGALLEYALRERNANTLWALEKNERAIAFYQRYGFCITGERKPEEDTEEYLIRLERQ